MSKTKKAQLKAYIKMKIIGKGKIFFKTVNNFDD